jgi:hypothetical protein
MRLWNWQYQINMLSIFSPCEYSLARGENGYWTQKLIHVFRWSSIGRREGRGNVTAENFIALTRKHFLVFLHTTMDICSRCRCHSFLAPSQRQEEAAAKSVHKAAEVTDECKWLRYISPYIKVGFRDSSPWDPKGGGEVALVTLAPTVNDSCLQNMTISLQPTTKKMEYSPIPKPEKSATYHLSAHLPNRHKRRLVLICKKKYAERIQYCAYRT